MDTQRVSLSKTKVMVTTAIMLGLAAGLSLIKVYKLPLGGSITALSMLPICMVSIVYGVKIGLATSFLYSLIQIAMDLGSIMSMGLTLWTWVGCIAFDYIIAFTVIGLAGMFRKKGTKGVVFGVVLVMILRFASHFVSGVIIFEDWAGWDNYYLWSLCYNGSYMLPEAIFTAIGAVCLFSTSQIKKIIRI